MAEDLNETDITPEEAERRAKELAHRLLNNASRKTHAKTR
jgi:hypothetical protein